MNAPHPSLQASKPANEASQKPQLSRRKLAALALIALLLSSGLYLAKGAYHLWTAAAALHGLQTLATTTSATTAVSEEELAQAKRHLTQASEALLAFQGHIGPTRPLLTNAGWVPRAGQYLILTPQLADFGASLTQGADLALTGLSPLLITLNDDASVAEGLLSLAQQRDTLFRAYALIGEARAQREKMGPIEALPPRLAGLFGQLDRRLPELQGALGLGAVLPGLLGHDSPKTYLLLGHNNDELRATGGFISSAGLITAAQGEVTKMEYEDSYAFDAPLGRPFIAPPEPYRRYLLLEDWRLRDANWWADFPTSARQALGFLALDQGGHADGVMAFDQQFLERILTVTGLIPIPAYQEEITEQNVVELLEAYAHPPGYKEGDSGQGDTRKVKPEDRKGLIRELAHALVAKVQSLPPADLLALAQALRSTLEEKHLLLYFTDSQAARVAQDLGWDGAVRPPHDSDYLFVVETNVGYSKANRYVERALDYRLEIGANRTPERATVTISYRNNNAAAARHCSAEEVDFFTADDSCYKSYVRVYTPWGTAPQGAFGITGAPEWYQEGEAFVLAGLLVLQPGEARTVQFSYIPPRSILAHADFYRLSVQKQPGASPIPVTVTVAFREEQRTSLTLERDQQVIIPLP